MKERPQPRIVVVHELVRPSLDVGSWPVVLFTWGEIADVETCYSFVPPATEGKAREEKGGERKGKKRGVPAV